MVGQTTLKPKYLYVKIVLSLFYDINMIGLKLLFVQVISKLFFNTTLTLKCSFKCYYEFYPSLIDMFLS